MFQVRLRVYVREGMTSDQAMLRVILAGREVEITSGSDSGSPLTGKKWIRFRAGGIETREEALEFGRRLQSWVQIASICCMWGIDLGGGTYSLNLEDVKFKLENAEGPAEFAHQERHGLLIIEDDSRIRFFNITGSLTVSRPTQEFFEALGDLSASDMELSEQTQNSLRLINQALVNREPLAQIVLALSAVENLGQSQKWTNEQRKLISDIIQTVRNDGSIPEFERAEVAEMLDRSHRIGLRQGVKRVLAELKLSSLLAEWDRVYGIRSQIFHNSDNRLNIPASIVAHDAIRLCGRIVLALAARDGLKIPETALHHFPLLR